MVTVVNNPQPVSTTSDEGGGMGFLLGAILILIVVFMLIYFGLPIMRNISQGPQLNVPNKVNVDVNLRK